MILEIIKYAELTTKADVKVLHFISESQIPCHWESKILAIVPNNEAFAKIKQIWKSLRDPLKIEIGKIEIPFSLEIFIAKNSATSIQELYSDEQEGAALFLNTCQEIAEKSGGKAHFGPNNINIIKSIASMDSKVQRMQTESDCTIAYAIQHIDDGVRGTLSFEKPSQLKQGVETFIQFAKEKGWKIECSNLWENEFDYSGYLDVDARIIIPLPGNRQVIAELQFHLNDFYDGTKESTVSRAHKVYEELRMIPVTGESPTNLSFDELNETSRLYFTSALFHSTRTNNS